MRQAGSKIDHEDFGVLNIAAADQPASYKLGLGVNRHPGIHVATAKIATAHRRDVAFLRADKAPNLVALNPLAGQVFQVFELVQLAGGSNVHEQFGNGITAHVCQPGCCAKGHSFRQASEDLNSFLDWQAVHTVSSQALVSVYLESMSSTWFSLMTLKLLRCNSQQ